MESYYADKQIDKCLELGEKFEKNERNHLNHTYQYQIQKYLAEMYMLRGDCYLSQNQNTQLALQNYTTCYEKDPQNCRALIRAAMMHIGMQEPSKAVELLRRVTQIDPSNGQAQKLLEQVSK